jgi:hypothetical protein
MVRCFDKNPIFDKNKTKTIGFSMPYEICKMECENGMYKLEWHKKCTDGMCKMQNEMSMECHIF